MWRATACGWMMAILSAASAQTQSTNITDATPAEYGYLQKLPEAIGKLGSFNASSKQFTLLVEYQAGPPKVSGPLADIQRIVQSLAREQQMLAVAGSPRAVNDRLNNIQRLQVQLVRAQTQYRAEQARNAAKGPQGPFKKFEMAAIEKAEVRMGFLPVRYDDKGNLKEYSKEEMAKFRSGGKIGIPATFEDLSAGQVIKVVLAKSSQKSSTSGSKKTSDDTPPEINRVQVATIIILAEPTDPNAKNSSR